jgi:nitroreductase / dihydropteridine reductase
MNEHRKWRYATKKFDTSKKVSESDFNTILEALQLTATGYGLQPYKFIVVKNETVREQLQGQAYGQTPVTEASHFLVLAAKTTLSNDYIDKYVALNETIRKMEAGSLSGFGDMMKGSFNGKSSADVTSWSSKQCYIALGTLLDVCASMKIDALPMEGFNAKGFNEVLGLEAKELTAAVVCAIGYRSEEDKYQFAPKVRKALSDLIETV